MCAAFAVATDGPNQNLEQRFQVALTQFNAGHYAEASAQLESLAASQPKSFEIQELLGLSYTAQSMDAKATEHLELAVRLKPDSAEARTNLAANLSRLGKLDQAGEQFRKALALEPKNYDANHNLGEYYIQSDKI